uniref:Photosystem II extrinsic protein V n=1 Tax=Karlodinium veneficum TaxID=407301 RepID=G1E7A2_KARVE|nr:cytochrome c550 of photosystem II [Karlodinium veneficum]
MKNSIFLGIIVLTSFIKSNPAIALDLKENIRTVSFDTTDKIVVITKTQIKRGKRLFTNACANCHVGGVTKPDPNIGLDMIALRFATPPKNNIVNLVAYFKDPITYDGLYSISELHPSIKGADLFPKMRFLTDEDLFSVAGYILYQYNILGDRWGGGKVYY